MIATELKCEYQYDPLGVDCSKPRLSWIPLAQKSKATQKAYHIIAATNEALLDKDKGDVWDSGILCSDQTTHVDYSGRPLTSCDRVFWKIRLWNEESVAGNWSEVATWEMGLLQPTDWNGYWIARAEDTYSQPAPLFRKTFCLDKDIQKARCYITGLGYCELSVNGSKVDNRILDPAFTNYNQRVLYSTFDITSQLKTGTNVLAVTLGNGWYNCHTKNEWRFEQAPWRKSPRFICEVRVQLVDGSTQTITTDDTWKTSTGPLVTDSIYSGEVYDTRLEQPGWDGIDFDDSQWNSVIRVSGPSGVLASQQIPPIKPTATLRPKHITYGQTGGVVVDFGQNFAGWPRITAKGNIGTTITMECVERLTPDTHPDSVENDVYVKGLDPSQQFQTDVFILKGHDEEVYEPRFTYHGMQYCKVSGYPGKLASENISGIAVNTAVESAGHFECSNPLLNTIWRNTRWSHLSNLHGYPTDCPHREKMGWTGDSHLAAEQGIFNFDMAAVYTKWLTDLRDAQRENGELSCIAPSGGWGYPEGDNRVGPAWDSALILIPWYMYLYYGDIRVLEENYSAMCNMLHNLIDYSQDYICSIGLGDWCFSQDQTPVELTSTAYLYSDTMFLARIAAILGSEHDSDKYSILAQRIRNAFNKKFFDKASCSYANGTQTALSASLYHGLVPSEYEKKILTNLLNKIAQDDYHINAGILGSKYVMQVLTDFGRTDIAYRIASKTTFPSWGYWVEQGATTLWEHWNGKNSRNHIMFGDISAWFFKALGGINPDPVKPGFQNIVIRPNPVGDLQYVHAEYQSIRGKIKSHWHRHKNTFHLTVKIPTNTGADVYMPDGQSFTLPSGEHSMKCNLS